MTTQEKIDSIVILFEIIQFYNKSRPHEPIVGTPWFITDSRDEIVKLAESKIEYLISII